MECQPLTEIEYEPPKIPEADETEFAPSVDDCPAIVEFIQEGITYDPYRITPKAGCGGFLDCFG